MAIRPIQLAAQSYPDRAKSLTSERLVNMYPERKPQSAKGPVGLYGTPGLTLWDVAGDGPIRGMWSPGSRVTDLDGDLESDNIYVASGAEMYAAGDAYVSYNAMIDDLFPSLGIDRTSKVFYNPASGSLPSGDPLSYSFNSTYSVFAGSTGAVYLDITGGLVSKGRPGDLLDLEAGGAALNSTAQIDGYHLLAKEGTDVWYVATTTTIDTLDNAIANAHPDKILAIEVVGRDVWIIGERSCQIYYNSGQADFPFTRHPGGILEVGTIAAGSVASHEGLAIWLADDLSVQATNGLATRAISNPALERKFASYASPSLATAFMYAQDQHLFYVLTFPSVATWVFDVSTGAWHERRSTGRNDWRALCAVRYNDKILVGDDTNGNIYELDPYVYTENGTTIQREIITPPVFTDGSRAFMRTFEIEAEAGIGLTSGQGVTPQIALQISDDGGNTWGSELWRSLGVQGDYAKRARWNRLGAFRERALRLTMSDPVKWVLYGATADIDPGGV